MPEVNGPTLMMAVQAVDAKIQHLLSQIQQADENDVADLEELMLSYMKAADELRQAYETALILTGNLPPYSTLVRETNSR